MADEVPNTGSLSNAQRAELVKTALRNLHLFGPDIERQRFPHARAELEGRLRATEHP